MLTKTRVMRLNYSVITSVLMLLLMLMMMSVRVQAQTASSRPRSAIITPLMQTHLDSKPQAPSGNVGSAVLPSNSGIPQKAQQAKQSHSNQRPPGLIQLPSSSRVDIDKIRRRNSVQKAN